MIERLPLFFAGLQITIVLSAASMVGSLVLGVSVALLRMSPSPALRAIGMIWVELFRNLPPIVLLLYIFFALPHAGVRLDSVPSGILGLSFYGSAFVAEAIRGGILSIDRRHFETARMLGLSRPLTARLVVLPLAAHAALPSLTTVLITLLKTTALAGVVGVYDLMSRARTAQSETFLTFESLGIAALGYLVLSLSIGALSGSLERRIAVRRD